MKRKVLIFTGAILLFSFFYFNLKNSAFCSSALDEYKSPRHIAWDHGVWGFEFDVSASVSANGKATANISGLRPYNSGSWASLSLKPHILKVSKSSNRITVVMEVKLKGRARRYSRPGGSDSVNWGEAGKEPFTDTKKVSVMLSFDEHPELAGIENLHPGECAETVLDQESSSQKPEDSEEATQISYLVSTSGFVRIKKAPGNNWIKAVKNMKLEPGDTVKTLANGKATVNLKGGDAIINVKPGTEFKMPKDQVEKQTFIEMIKGFLFARAKKDRDSLKIATPNAICGVRGTEFEVMFKDGVTWLNVLEGSVWFSDRSGSGEVVLNAGESATMPEGSEIPELPAQEAVGISGKWKTNFGTVTFIQNNDKITGTYPHDDGKIEGRLEGDFLRGKWSEAPSYKPPKDAGDMEFLFSEDENSFKGKWRYGFDKQTWKGDWNGSRIE